MDLPWRCSSLRSTEDIAPPWVRHSRLRVQQEICVKRFLRFASQDHVYGAILLWALTLWLVGVHIILAILPLIFFTGLALVGRPTLLVEAGALESASKLVLVLDAVNALHLSVICSVHGDLVAQSPLLVLLSLPRVVLGLFTHEVHWHFRLSSCVAVVAAIFGGSGRVTCIVLSSLILELCAVIILVGGPSSYEDAMLHLTQWRVQHQLMRAQAVQFVDFERERFNGQLLTVASRSIAELTSSVKHASDPVLRMLQSSCSTGTKSAREAERIGKVGESLKDEVAKILMYKTQATSGKLQELAKRRAEDLRMYAASQKARSEAARRTLHDLVGESVARMHELELEGESSLEQLLQGEVSRAYETAHARMDLVRQSAEAMEQRVSDTVEVLLSLLKYFRSKCGNTELREVPPIQPLALQPQGSTPKGREGRRRPRNSTSLLFAIDEGDLPERSDCDISEARNGELDTTEALAQHDSTITLKQGHVRVLTRQTACVDTVAKETVDSDGHGSTRGSDTASTCGGASDIGVPSDVDASDHMATTRTLTASYDRSGDASFALGSDDSAAPGSIAPLCDRTFSERVTEGGLSAPMIPASPLVSSTPSPRSSALCVDSLSTATGCTGGGPVSGSIIERHPLFATRLAYRTENFYWSWASARDFRSELDALRLWHRSCAAQRPGANVQKHRLPTSGTGSSAIFTPRACGDAMPTEVVVDLSALELGSHKGQGAS